MTVVGVDISSRRVDLAWIEDGKPQRWHQELGKGVLIDRLREIEIRWPNYGNDVGDVAIEYPFGRSRATVAALCAVAGIVTRQAPPWARVAWPSAGELRAAIGAKNTKHSAHDALGRHVITQHWPEPWTWNEHERDALVACLGWQAIIEAQDEQ